MDNQNSTINMMIAQYSAIFGISLLLLFGAVFYYVLGGSNVGFGAVAALVLVGLAFFLGLMAVFSFISSWVGMLDPKQAFGLPEGSVRAILTMAFIVIVGVLASYLITQTSGTSSINDKVFVTIGGGLNLQQAQDLMKASPSTEGVVGLRQAPQETPKDGGPGAGSSKFDVVLYPRIDNRLKEDVSKQILTILSTILAAMIGFYFGARPGDSDPAAVKRANAMSAIIKVVATSPDTKPLLESAQALADAPGTAPDKKTKALALVEQLKTAQASIDNAKTTLMAPDTTAEQMANAATSASAAVLDIEKARGAIETLEKS